VSIAICREKLVKKGASNLLLLFMWILSFWTSRNTGYYLDKKLL